MCSLVIYLFSETKEGYNLNKMAVSSILLKKFFHIAKCTTFTILQELYAVSGSFSSQACQILSSNHNYLQIMYTLLVVREILTCNYPIKLKRINSTMQLVISLICLLIVTHSLGPKYLSFGAV